MRWLAVGDIHGCLGALRTLADAVPFDVADGVVTLGDHVDRGPDSFGVIEWLLDWGRGHRLVCLRGNHEILMVEGSRDRFGLRPWLEAGGMATLDSYRRAGRSSSGGASLVPPSHEAFLASCVPWHETETHLFVHASVDPALPLEAQDENRLFWTRADFSAPPHLSGKHVVCGHTALRDGVPRTNGHLTCIDTFAYGGGWLTALDVRTGAYWQAKESGETRRGMLEMPSAAG